MRFFIIFIFYSSVLFSQTNSSSAPQSATVTGLEEDDEYISVFTTPGQTYKFCPPGKKCTPAIGWLDRDAKIEILSEPEKHITQQLRSDELTEEEYRKIKFDYIRNGYIQSGEGYIPNEHVSMKPTKPLYSTRIKKEKKPACPPKTITSELSQLQDAIKPMTKSIENVDINQQADVLRKIVGFCPLTPSNKAPTDLPGRKTNLYDHFVKSKLMNQNVPKMLDESNKQITSSQLVEIDSMARTMYAEMALCYKSGLQYPMAVAKIILNRADKTSRHKDFIKPPHSPPKPDVAKVCTSPSQFNCWMKKVNGTQNNTLHHALCPAQDENKPFWRGKSAPRFESDLWKNSVRIATEAILHPTKFNKRTADIKGYFYTSGMGKFYNMKQQKGLKIDGNPIDRSRCLEIWKE
jgi:hypothetical protein